MKITKLFLLSIVVLLFSCSEDDDAPLPTSDGLIGTWNVVAVDYSGTTTTTYAGQTAKANFTGKGKDFDYTTTFTANPNTVKSEGSYTIELTTTTAGQTTKEDYEFEDVLVDGTWQLNGKTLSITNANETQEGTITKQTDTTLEVRLDMVEEYTISEVKITSKIKGVYKFEKATP